MVLKTVQGDILLGQEPHVAFAISTEGKGYNRGGFSGTLISRGIWPELADIGGLKLGQVVSREDQKTGRVYHAVVAHSFGSNGWQKSAEAVAKAMAKIPAPMNATIAVVAIGTGSAGKAGGANPTAIREAIEKSGRKVVLYEYD